MNKWDKVTTGDSCPECGSILTIVFKGMFYLQCTKEPNHNRIATAEEIKDYSLLHNVLK